VYQGTEFWDLSLVDPDNRRPVDYRKRSEWLEAMESEEDEANAVAQLWAERASGRIKLWLTHRLLALRSEDKALFSKGLYVPLRVSGHYKENIIAFARRYERRWIVVAVPLHLAATGQDPMQMDWKNTVIHFPPDAPDRWQNMLTGEGGQQSGSIAVKDIFSGLPIALLRLARAENKRSAGVLMPVTSLPSPFSIGDFGPEARSFAKALSRAGQRYWQVLPLNPVSEGSGFSPYSSISTMAGNTLLISPELLLEEGLLTEADLKQYRKAPSAKVAYGSAQKHKTALLDLAFENYRKQSSPHIRQAVDSYRKKERAWVEDFALYVVIRRAQGETPWYEWPEPLRLRERDALQAFSEDHAEEIEKIIWQQATFTRQWESLREWCKSLGVQLIGDLPFYASYDSADVWTHPEIFSLDEHGKMTGIAGVPPDYFSETGQLWGMPTFKWDVLEKDNYRWWIDRLRKNLQLYDLLRIDHFRALAAYWEVPAGETTAIKGEWIPGPGTRFFDAVREAFGGLPFIAEDLGDNMDDVYKLRDEVGLPGMKVMQFAFGDNHPVSVDVPHNYGLNSVAYTGTHDNNTTLGWFRGETKPEDRQRLSRYVHTKVTAKNAVSVMMKLAYGSVAQMAILPMQDVLGLDEHARMNTPSSGNGNWGWQMKPGQFGDEQIALLHELSNTYNRL
jgi:4-alpha-glucanotransferase